MSKPVNKSAAEGDGPELVPFPKKTLETLEKSVIPNDNWTIPVQKGADLEVLMKEYLRMYREKRADDPLCVRFANGGLLCSFEKVLTYGAVQNWPEDIQRNIYDLLMLFVEIACEVITPDAPMQPFWAILANAFDPNCQFHIRNEESYPLFKPASDAVFALPKHGIAPYGWLVDIINLFGKLGGFDKILAYAQNEQVRSSQLLLHLIRPLAVSARYLTPHALEKYVRPVTAIVKAYFAQLDGDALRKESIDLAKGEALRWIFKSLKDLRSLEVPAADAAREYDGEFLTMLLRLLKGKSFNGLLYALNEIKRLIATSHSIKKDAPLYLTSVRLAQWVIDNDVIKIVFTDHLHQSQYVSKLECIVKLLMNEHMLTTEHLSLIWNAQKDKHEAIVTNIYDILSKLAYYFETEQLDHLFNCFKDSWGGSEKQMMKLLDFIRQLAEDDTEGKMALKVLDLLWTLARQEDAPTNIVQAALDAQVRILNNGYIKDKDAVRERWIVACVDDVRSGRWIVPALRHIRAIADLFMLHDPRVPFNTRIKYRHQLAQDLQHNLHVADLVVQTLVSYCESARTALAALPEGAKADEHAVSGRYTHRATVEECLQFVRYIQWEATMQLAVDAARSLWDALVTKPPTPADSAYTLDWFRSMVDDNLLAEQTVRALFSEKILSMDVTTMTLEGFMCFEQFFVMENVACGHAIRMQRIVFASLTPVGAEMVWAIALQCPTEEIASRALSILREMRSCVVPQLRATTDLHDRFFTDCMEHLGEAYFQLRHSPPETQAEREVLHRKIVRCLMLLEEYMATYDNLNGRMRAFPPHGTSFRADELPVTISAPTMREPEGSHVFHSNSLLRQLRLHVAHMQGVDTGVVSLSYGDKPLLPEHDNKPLRWFGLRPGCTVVAATETHDTGSRASTLLPAQLEYDRLMPSFMLSRRPDFMAKFHELAVFPSSLQVQGKARNLLSALPSDPEMRATLHTILLSAAANPAQAAKELLAYLQPEGVYPALYRAQLLLSLLAPNEAHGAQAEDAVELAAGVKALELPQLLMGLLPGSMYRCDSPLDRADKCSLLRVLSTMIRTAIITSASATARTKGADLKSAVVAPTELAERLLQFAWAAGTGNAVSTVRNMDVEADHASNGTGHANGHTVPSGATPTPNGGGSSSSSSKNNNASAMSQEEVGLAMDAIAALHPCLQLSEVFRAAFISHPDAPALFRDLLLSSPHQPIRSAIVARLSKLFQFPQLVGGLYDIMLGLRVNVDAHKDTCGDFFDFLCRLTERVYSDKPADDSARAQLEAESQWLASPPPAPERSEALLAGHLRLCAVLVNICSTQRRAVGELLLEKLLHKFLFPASALIAAVREKGGEIVIDGTTPLCETATSRVPAFALLVSLATGCAANLQYVVDVVRALHMSKDEEAIDEWEYLPQISPKADTGQLGLKNAGATCYMNAVMQQLYMQPDIRSAVLEAGELQDEKLVENILYQLQVAFAHMQHGHMQYYTPDGLWKSYRRFGEPINVREQQDAAEFFNGIVDQVDEKFKAAGKPQMLSKIFGGLFADQKIVKAGCEHRYETDAPFTTLSIGVHGYSNLQESLNNYIKGDLLEGANAYKCDNCGGEKRDTVKRMCIKTLPRVLVIHLSRFDYDYEKDQPVKFNDYFEFPRDLDMGPYTAAGLAAIESQSGEVPKHPFRLSGVVVHSGQANGGHYYSFIRLRDGEAGKQWLRFDDTDVTFASVSGEGDQRNEWFGGEYTADVWDPHLKKFISKTRERWWNGYLLFYERVEDGESSTAASADAATFSVPQPTGTPAQGILRKVQEENLKFYHHRYMFSTEFFDFFKNLASANGSWLSSVKDSADQEVALSRNVIGLACTQLAFDFLVRYGFRIHRSIRGTLGEWPRIMTSLIAACPDARSWLMAQFCVDEKLHLSHLVQCTNKDVRTTYQAILSAAILYTFNQEGVPAGIATADRVFDLILPFMKKELRTHWKLFGQYFAFIHEYALLGAEQRQHLQTRGMLDALLRFLHVDFNWQKCITVDFTNVHAIIGVLIRASNLSGMEDPSTADDGPNPYQELSFNPLANSSPRPLLEPAPQIKESVVGQMGYLSDALSQMAGSPHLTLLAQCLVWRSTQCSVRFINEILYRISTSPTHEIKPYFDLLFSILSVPDFLQARRVPYTLRGNNSLHGLLADMEGFKSRQIKRTYFYIRFLGRLLRENEVANRLLLSEPMVSIWSWACSWLDYELQPANQNDDPNVRGPSNEIPSNSMYLERSESAINLLALLHESIPAELLEMEEEDEDMAEKMDEEESAFSSQSEDDAHTSG